MLFSPEQKYDIEGKNGVVVFGDTHFSAVFSGAHKDYQEECLDSMARMIDIVKKEKPSAVILLGDLIGVSERVIRDLRFLLEVTVFLQTLNNLTDGCVFVVRGNHDIGDFPQFEYFKGIGLIKTPTEVDHYVDNQLMVRYHFVSYGEEKRPLRYKGVEDGVHQIVFGHNHYSIAGVTNWFYSKGGIELATLGNFEHVSWLISGHIHHPSPEIYSQTMGENEMFLFYPGAVNRVSASEQYADCFYFKLFYNEEEDGFDYEIKRFGLKPASEVFIEEKVKEELDEDVMDDTEKAEANKRLTEILNEAMGYRIVTGNLIEQIDNFPVATDEVKAIAKSYLQKAIDMV